MPSDSALDIARDWMGYFDGRTAHLGKCVNMEQDRVANLARDIDAAIRAACERQREACAAIANKEADDFQRAAWPGDFSAAGGCASVAKLIVAMPLVCDTEQEP